MLKKQKTKKKKKQNTREWAQDKARVSEYYISMTAGAHATATDFYFFIFFLF